jgi:hypothetical protein
MRNSMKSGKFRLILRNASALMAVLSATAGASAQKESRLETKSPTVRKESLRSGTAVVVAAPADAKEGQNDAASEIGPVTGAPHGDSCN